MRHLHGVARELGFNAVISHLGPFGVHWGFSYPTRLAHSWLPGPLFWVHVGSTHKAKASQGKLRRILQNFTPSFVSCRGDVRRTCAGSFAEHFRLHVYKHGSDGETYVRQFEETLAKHGKSDDGTRTLNELSELIYGHRSAADISRVSMSHQLTSALYAKRV